MVGSDSEAVVVQVPFSEFVRRLKHNDVQSVSIDGLHINFGLKPGSLLLENTPRGSDNTQVSFATVRPADYNVPYDLLESNSVQFSAVDKRNNKFLTIMVSSQRYKQLLCGACTGRLVFLLYLLCIYPHVWTLNPPRVVHDMRATQFPICISVHAITMC